MHMHLVSIFLLSRIALIGIIKMKKKEKETAIDTVAVSDYIRKNCREKKERNIARQSNYLLLISSFFVYSLKMID